MLLNALHSSEQIREQLALGLNPPAWRRRLQDREQAPPSWSPVRRRRPRTDRLLFWSVDERPRKAFHRRLPDTRRL